MRGVIAILFGAAIFSRPIVSAGVLVLVFGAFALAGGALAVVAAIGGIGVFRYWWALLAEGLVGIVMGLMTFFWPGITALALVYFIGVWAVVTGVFQVVGAFSGHEWASNRWLSVFAGLISIGLGIYLFASPGLGFLAVTLGIGIWALVFGASQIALGIQLNHLDHWLHAQSGGMRPAVQA